MEKTGSWKRGGSTIQYWRNEEDDISKDMKFSIIETQRQALVKSNNKDTTKLIRNQNSSTVRRASEKN